MDAFKTVFKYYFSDKENRKSIEKTGIKTMIKTKKLLTTAIEWVLNSDGTRGYAVNLWIGCTKMSPACDNCYAEVSRVSTCLGVKWGDNQPRYKCKTALKRLLSINKKAQVPIESWEMQKAEWNLTDAEMIESGFIKPPRIRVFINPDSDIFDNKVPQEWRDEFWEVVEQTPYIDYILCTKRIGNAKRMIPQSWLDDGYPLNVWQLITVCNQAEAYRDIPKLLELNAVVRGLSIEPMLESIIIPNVYLESLKFDGKEVEYPDGLGILNWLIVGGESGKNARPMHQQWARKIRDQCIDANVPFFFKQWGEWINSDHCERDEKGFSCMDGEALLFNKKDYGTIDEDGNFKFKNLMTDKLGVKMVYKIGKKRAGNLLDGQIWQQMPMV